MARHIILEVKGLNASTTNPNKKELEKLSSQTGQPVMAVDSLENDTPTDNSKQNIITSAGGRSVRRHFKTQSVYRAAKAQQQATLEDIALAQTKDAQDQIDNTHAVNEIAKADNKGNLNLDKERKAKIKKTTGVITAATHYAKQAYDLYAQHQQNTYTMAGLTTASIKLKKQQQMFGLANKAVGIGVAFAINPVLGLAQTAMTVAQTAFDFVEKQRTYQFNLQKENYSANYYRSRLVRNNKVLI